MKYELVMGLEVHVELATQSKLFCSCSAKFGAQANENVCPACAGMPGMLPVANKRAIELGMIASILTNSEITRKITFDKKNYFYPDLSTGYQVTQWFAPICRNGYVDIKTSKGKKRIGLKQIHIEEDAGKLVHDYRTDTSLVDYNRAGVPLNEIVSMPDFRSAEEVIAYLEKLRSMLSFAGVSDCRMQEGSMRCDVNISVREMGSDMLGTRVEIKNMNSLKAIERAIEYEYSRQCEALETGCETLRQETRRWDDSKGETYAMRSKEDAAEYRYFPYADIMPIVISDEWIAQVRASIPELAQEKKARLMAMGLPEYDCDIICGNKALSEIFDEAYSHTKKPKAIANWLIVDLLAMAKDEGVASDELRLNAGSLAALISLVDEGVVNRGVAKAVLLEVFKNDVDPAAYIREKGLGMVSDKGRIVEIIRETLEENPKSVMEYKEGNGKVIPFFVGRIMKKMQGKADPRIVNEELRRQLIDDNKI